MTHAPDNHESLSALATLMQSPHARAAVMWIGGILWTTLVAVGGWAGGKLDSRLEIERVSGKQDVLSGQIAVVIAQQNDLAKSVESMSSTDPKHPGRLFVLDNETRYAQRTAVFASVIALSYETVARKKQKIAATKEFIDSFNDKTGLGGKLPSDAAELVLARATP